MERNHYAGFDNSLVEKLADLKDESLEKVIEELLNFEVEEQIKKAESNEQLKEQLRLALGKIWGITQLFDQINDLHKKIMSKNSAEAERIFNDFINFKVNYTELMKNLLANQLNKRSKIYKGEFQSQFKLAVLPQDLKIKLKEFQEQGANLKHTYESFLDNNNEKKCCIM